VEECKELDTSSGCQRVGANPSPKPSKMIIALCDTMTFTHPSLVNKIRESLRENDKKSRLVGIPRLDRI
jgi:hypothetical protein